MSRRNRFLIGHGRRWDGDVEVTAQLRGEKDVIPKLNTITLEQESVRLLAEDVKRRSLDPRAFS